MNPVILRYASIALVAAVLGAGGEYLALNGKINKAAPSSGTTVAIPARPFPGQGIPAIPAVPAVPKANSDANVKNGVTVLTPNGGEKYVIGKDRIHVSWSGGLEKVWIVLVLYANPGGPVVDWWNSILAVLNDNGAPSGAFDWDGNYCKLYLKAEGGYFVSDDCAAITPGSYKILAVSQTDPNVPITYDSLDPLLAPVYSKNSKDNYVESNYANYDLSDNPFTMFAQ